MNKQRRAAIDAVLKDLATVRDYLVAVPDVDAIVETIDDAAEGEREYYDNVPENMQGSERGEAAEQAASALEEAASSLEGLGVGDVLERVDEVIAQLEAARDGG